MQNKSRGISRGPTRNDIRMMPDRYVRGGTLENGNQLATVNGVLMQTRSAGNMVLSPVMPTSRSSNRQAPAKSRRALGTL